MPTAPTTQDVKDYLRNEKPTEDDAFYTDALAAAVQTMNDECQRNFAIAGAAAARTFVPECDSNILHIGDCTSVTSVVENGTTLTVGTHYQLEPVTTTTVAGLVIPFNSLRRLGAYWYTNDGRGTVVVTAAWGHATVPTRVVESIKIIAKDIIENRDVKLGLVAVTDVAGVSARTNPVVLATIAKYRGVQSWGIG